MRTLVDIPEEKIRSLDAIAARRKESRAALIRRAVDKLLNEEKVVSIDDAFGLWKDRADIKDGLDYQLKIRAEWDRDWDPD